MPQKFVVRHNLDKLSPEELTQYLREVSAFIGLDPDLSGLDTIWMENETGAGRSLVVYARRGTAEILRNLYEVEVETLTYAEVKGSIVFTATGRSKTRNNRQEIAIGSKYIAGLTGKTLDDAIMTASTRALRRLTMQFTTLGILDESEVVAVIGQSPNPAGSAQLAPNPLPPMYAAPTVPANNAPGKPVESTPAPTPAPAAPVALSEPFVGQQDQIDAAWKQQADKKAGEKAPEKPVTPVESTTSPAPEPDKKPDTEAVAPKPKRARKSRAVSLDVEPEVVQTPANPQADAVAKKELETAGFSAPQATSVAPPPAPTQADSAVPTQADDANKAVEDLLKPDPGMPTTEQMDAYRKKVGAITEQLTPGVGMGKTQKMRAFIAKMSGAAPQNMTNDQWTVMLSWFDKQVAEKGFLGLIAHIDATLGQ